MNAVTIFIDESGTLPDKEDKVIIIAAVGTINPSKIDTIIKQVKKRGSFRKQTGELKFYTVGNKTKKLFLEKIVKEDFSIYVLVVEKLGRKIPDTPENFAILCSFLLSDVLDFDRAIETVIFDRHFSSENDIDSFNKYLLQSMGTELTLQHVDSKKDKRVNIADMIAGAVLAYESGKTEEFYQIIVQKFVSIKRITWKEVKRSFYIKNLLEPMHAPIQSKLIECSINEFCCHCKVL